MEDTIKLPLDADGVPIKPGDVVYRVGHPEDEPLIVASLRYLDREYISWDFTATGKDAFYNPKAFTHIKPDTLEDIEQSIRELAKRAVMRSPFELEIVTLMERIKRMVER